MCGFGVVFDTDCTEGDNVVGDKLRDARIDVCRAFQYDAGKRRLPVLHLPDYFSVFFSERRNSVSGMGENPLGDGMKAASATRSVWPCDAFITSIDEVDFAQHRFGVFRVKKLIMLQIRG